MRICVPVPGEGELRLGAVSLPPGRLLRLADGTGVGWITQAPVREPGPAWTALSALHGETGLIPVLVPGPGSRRPGGGAALVHGFPSCPGPGGPPRRCPADVLPVLGWCPGNWNGACPVPTPVGFAAVLRSWEERFGARLLALTHDQAYLLVEHPPRDLAAALPVAAEHFTFCDEPAGRQPVQKTAEEIVNAPLWYFWWD